MTLRAAVIGAGSIGRHHVRVYNQLADVALAGVADPDAARRAAVERQYRVPAYASYEALIEAERPDLVSIAAPTVLHRPLAEACLERGIHVLVEKPMAATVEDARALIARAAAAGLVLAVGHVERYNPAVIELSRRLAAGEIGRLFQIHARRLSPFPAYIHDVGVVMDLATHDLDILCELAGGTPARLHAETGRNVHRQYEDVLSAMLRFDNGVLGVLDVNWLTPVKVRELRVTGERGMFIVDYIAQDLFFYENRIAPSRWDAMALFRGVEEGDVVKARIGKVEPLEAELRAFAAAVAGRSEAVAAAAVVSGEDGLRAVALATLLVEAGEGGRVLDVTEEVRRRGWTELSPGGDLRLGRGPLTGVFDDAG
jgi:predicted dehydrogenase